MDGLKARLSFDAVAYDYDDEYLTIDTDTHIININNLSRLFGVQYDGNSKLIKFRIRNQLSDIQKMQDSIVYINWIDSKGVKGQSIAINKTINNETCEFAWKVPFDALKNSGVLHFAMNAVVTKDSSSVIDQRWSTQIASVITPDGIYIKSYTPSSEEEDRIAQIYNELSNMINKQSDNLNNLQTQVNQLNEALANKIITDASVNKANPDEYADGFAVGTKILNLNQGYRHTGYIECKKNDVIRTIKSPKISEYQIVQYYDTNKTFVTNSVTSAQDNEIAEFTVPNTDEIAYCRVNFRIENQDTIMVTINSAYPSEFKPYYHIEYLNNISEKTIKGTILFSGDSICYGAGYSGGYPSIIKQNNPLADIVNYGVSGTTIAKQTGKTNSILERLENMQSNADFVIFEGGVNDAWTDTIELGTFAKNGNIDSTTTFDETTFSGALETLFNKAYRKYPNAHIMFIIVSVGDNYNTYEYLNRAKEICEKWKVTTIDIRKSGLNLMVKQCIELYGANGTDSTHPSKLGYKKFYVPMIEHEIKKFLLVN